MIGSILEVLAPEHRDVITTGGQVLIAMLGVATAWLGYLGFVNKRKTESVRELVEQAVKQATLAAQRSAPTGNGYAARTEAILNELKDGLRRVEDRLDRHIDQKDRP